MKKSIVDKVQETRHDKAGRQFPQDLDRKMAYVKRLKKSGILKEPTYNIANYSYSDQIAL